ncbi:uncharacterized protein TNCV_2147901 [Trichonephila clavipes]|uniref:Secreted protein n=1 Tax=Trichonephila clavipes TaxID=2585209 RepID=A0A8X6T2R0_TRICX|nr:uncharacterized protein TNCV_2147901 [Trichonephila clavipes]
MAWLVVAGLLHLRLWVRPRPSGRCSLLFKVLDRGWNVTRSSPVPLKTHRVRKRCTLKLSRTQMSSCWCGVEVRRGGASSDVILVTWPWFKITRYVVKCARVAEQCDVNIHSLTRLRAKSVDFHDAKNRHRPCRIIILHLRLPRVPVWLRCSQKN